MINFFKERGLYVSSYSILDTVENLDHGITSLVDGVGQIPVCCCPKYGIVFVTCLSRSIHVLSQELELLGFFYSCDRIGIPAGLSIDKENMLYLGDAVDGIVRVFIMDEFRNNIQRE